MGPPFCKSLPVYIVYNGSVSDLIFWNKAAAIFPYLQILDKFPTQFLVLFDGEADVQYNGAFCVT